MIKLGLYASIVSVIASVLIYVVLDVLYSQAYEKANRE